MYEVWKMYMSCYQLSVRCEWGEHREAGRVVEGRAWGSCVCAPSGVNVSLVFGVSPGVSGTRLS